MLFKTLRIPLGRIWNTRGSASEPTRQPRERKPVLHSAQYPQHCQARLGAKQDREMPQLINNFQKCGLSAPPSPRQSNVNWVRPPGQQQGVRKCARPSY